MSSVAVTEAQTRQLRAFIRALGADRWDVLVVRGKNEAEMRDNITPGGLERLLRWLQAMNSQGYHVFIRPAGRPDLAYLDDLDRDGLERLVRDGVKPLAVIETSPGRFQAWIRLPAADPEEARQQLRTLAQRYGADPAAVGLGRFGRLPGFTNPKPEHVGPDGRAPFARLVAAGGPAPDSPTPPRAGAVPPNPAATADPRPQTADRRPQTQDPNPYRAIWQALAEPFLRHDAALGRRPDYSRYDFNIARCLFRQGVDAAEVFRVLREGSPDLARRHPNTEDYLLRTVTRAAAWDE